MYTDREKETLDKLHEIMAEKERDRKSHVLAAAISACIRERAQLRYQPHIEVFNANG